MRSKLLYLLLILFIFPAGLRAQPEFSLSSPRLSMDGGELVIEYDLWTEQAGVMFEVHLEVRGAQGNLIRASSLRGEVGKDISRGYRKVIRWDLDADGVVLNEELTVDVVAGPVEPEPVVVASPAVEETPSVKEEQSPAERPSQASSPGARGNIPSYGGLLLRSVVFPGWGLSISTNKPHWIKGVAAYACLGGSVALNNMAVSSYNAFQAAETSEEAELFLDEARLRDGASRIMAYSALGIWLVDLAWTALGTRKGNGSVTLREKGISLHANMDPVSMQPMLGLAYRF